jgi:Tfp pilus assembly protein PilX
LWDSHRHSVHHAARQPPQAACRILPVPPGGQRGQALVFALFTSVLVILALFAMYSMGGQTIEKIKLQNTADAAAYSAALAEARDYNFSAYTNRAMVANQVACGAVRRPHLLVPQPLVLHQQQRLPPTSAAASFTS